MCVDCGREVSTRARHCVHCGRPFPACRGTGPAVLAGVVLSLLVVAGAVCAVRTLKCGRGDARVERKDAAPRAVVAPESKPATPAK